MSLSISFYSYIYIYDEKLTSQSQIQGLEDPAEKGKETGGDDKGNDTGKGSGRGARFFPLRQVRRGKFFFFFLEIKMDDLRSAGCRGGNDRLVGESLDTRPKRTDG